MGARLEERKMTRFADISKIVKLTPCLCLFVTFGYAETRIPEGRNALSAEEMEQGWKLLFDGITLPTNAFVGVNSGCKRFPDHGWVIENHALKVFPKSRITDEGAWQELPPEIRALGGGGDIVTIDKHCDFMFKFDFLLTKKANSGVKYFFDENQNHGTCEEYQILDSGHPDYAKGLNGNRKIAALYDLMPAPCAEKAVKPVGEWNQGMVVSRGKHVEHWLNGVKVLEYERGNEAFGQLVSRSKYAKLGRSKSGGEQAWGEVRQGRILLQDHTDSTVYFCNLKIKDL